METIDLANLVPASNKPTNTVTNMHSSIVRRVTDITKGLINIAEEGYDLKDLTRVWGDLPIGDSDSSSYLELASQCILEVSSLVDKRFPDLSREKRIAKKYHLMAELLKLKASQLESLEDY